MPLATSREHSSASTPSGRCAERAPSISHAAIAATPGLVIALRLQRTMSFGVPSPNPQTRHRRVCPATSSGSATLNRHGRACHGHPRLSLPHRKTWMAGSRPSAGPALAGTKFLLPPAVSQKPREAMTIWSDAVASHDSSAELDVHHRTLYLTFMLINN